MNAETSAIETQTTEATLQTPQTVTATQILWYRPAIDVLERGDALVLLFDLPGVSPKRIDVSTEDGRLTVEGVRTDGKRGWRRVLTLPPVYDASKIEAKADNGVLTLTIPKSEAAKPRKIEVR